MATRSPRRSPGRQAAGKYAIRSGLFSRAAWFVKHPVGKGILALTLLTAIGTGAALNHYWWKYSKVVDSKLAGGPFNRASKVLAAPSPVFLGEEMTPEDILVELREAGYSDSRHNPVGHYLLKEDSIEVYPGSLSYFAQEPAVLYFADGKISRIVSLNDNIPQTAYELEPQLVTHLFDDERSKRRLFKFEDFPPQLVQAILSIEDHRFYDHMGVDVIRTTKAALDGLMQWEQPRGTSTLTQQLARNFFLTFEQTYERKLAEALIAVQLELRLTKEQIFEYYANQIFMGRSGSFNVMGMGEAARAYFNKDARDLTLAESALLAGLPQGPSYLNPYRHPERALNRRSQVLRAMLRYGAIDEEAYKEAAQEELHLAQGHIESTAAPYYVDLVNDHLRETFASEELVTQDYWVYTTLDKDLQQAAVDAVRIGMQEVDERIAKQRRFKDKEPPRAQAALVAIDPSTGEVKAIVGGRDYGESQLNRVLAKRQPGSVFKPFVFAAALDTALDEERKQLVEEGEAELFEELGWSLYEPAEVYTPASLVDDVPTTFWYDEKPYEPANFMNKIYGLISFRYALRSSINIATVKVAQMAGYGRVAELAKRAKLGDDIQPTPSLALGSYEASPLQVAGAYSAFVNGGVRRKPYFVRMVRDSEGNPLQRSEPEETQVLDPRVAYLVTNMLEDVMTRGTGVGARYRYKFTEPSAGKTGTDDDGWFAGFTSNLLCVVWVGFDDNTDLSLEGAHSALPIWAEFMRRAHELRLYRNPKPFEAPEGVITVEIDPLTLELATPACSERQNEVFIAGSQPSRFCRLHGGGGGFTLATNVAGWDSQPIAEPGVEGEVPDSEAEPKKKNGFLKRIFGVLNKDK